ncbi:hypothetical protein L6V77_20615 [Myxococcota bacterium]|nr:hypothetical protein [Myxococcota bacterium]
MSDLRAETTERVALASYDEADNAAVQLAAASDGPEAGLRAQHPPPRR